jgi:MFS family permease
LTTAGAALPLLAGIVAVDRFAKGMRTPPRDALISLSTTSDQAGFAFGVHRAFDSAGAMLGPVVAVVLLAALPDRFDVVFLASFAVAVIGLGVLVLFVENIPKPAAAPAVECSPLRQWRSAHIVSMWPLLAAGTILSIASISDGFIYLLLQQKHAMNMGFFPILYVGTASAYLLLAVPAGRMADRIGRPATLLAGHAALALAYIVAAFAPGGALAAAECMLLVGAYYAMTDGVFMALAGAVVPSAHLATAMAVLTTATSTGRFVAAIAFGALWSLRSAPTAAVVFTCALIVAIAVAGVLLRAPHERQTADGAEQ